MKLKKFNEIDKNLEFWRDIWLNEKKLLNQSNYTIKNSKLIIDRFIEFCYLERVNSNYDIDFSDINKFFIQSYIFQLKEQGLKESSINTHLRYIYAFLKYISENNEDGIDLLHRFDKFFLKNRKKEIEVFNKEEIIKIEEYLINKMIKTKSYSTYRNALLIYFLLLTGARLNEMILLENSNVSIEDEFYKLKITGKGQKERFTYILIDKIEEYLEKFNYLKTKNNIQSIYFFPNKHSNMTSKISIQTFNKNMLNKLNIKKGSIHTYRHTFATILVEKNINLNTIKELLGHSNITTTVNFYAKVESKAKKEALKNI